MENEKFLPCKSCGKLLNSSASICPQCGDPTPFGWDNQDLISRAKMHSILMLFVYVIGFVVAFVPFGFVKPWWLALIVFFVIVFLLPLIRKWLNNILLSRVRHDIRHNLYITCQVDYKYNLSQEQFERWANKAEEIYINARTVKGE